jgi:hypothetical protein
MNARSVPGMEMNRVGLEIWPEWSEENAHQEKFWCPYLPGMDILILEDRNRL